jgi:hypothetical protein
MMKYFRIINGSGIHVFRRIIAGDIYFKLSGD